MHLVNGLVNSLRPYIQSDMYNQKLTTLCSQEARQVLYALLIYVNDILITCNDPVSIADIKKFLHNQFHLKDLRDFKYFLGIEILHLGKEFLFLKESMRWKLLRIHGYYGQLPLILTWNVT